MCAVCMRVHVCVHVCVCVCGCVWVRACVHPCVAFASVSRCVHQEHVRLMGHVQFHAHFTTLPILFRSMFNLTVSVSDGIANDTAYVEVTVTDNNDLYPVFEGVNSFTVEEEGPPQLVARLNASDGDQYPNNVVSTYVCGPQ